MTGRLPAPEAIAAFLASAPAGAGKREVAKHFGISGQDRIGLKAILKQMAVDGQLASKSRTPLNPRALPGILEVRIAAPARRGVEAVPAEWPSGAGEAPKIFVALGADDPVPKPGDRFIVKLKPGRGRRYAWSGSIIRRVGERPASLLGVFRPAPDGSGRVIPVDKKARRELTVARMDAADAQDGELVAVDILRERAMGLSAARVTERLGDIDDQRNVALIAIHAHGIPDAFPAAVLKEAAALRPVSDQGREDLRPLPLVTIDPADARDHDDAIFAAPDDDPVNPGGMRIIAAIADVAAYVTSGSALDREAARRGNSVYFPGRVVPMLPERISNDLCSLVADADRPVLACHITLDQRGHKRAHRFSRAIMRSRAALSYEAAQAAIDGRGAGIAGELREAVLEPLWAAYRLLGQERSRRQPMDIDVPERRLVLDARGHVSGVIVPKRLDAHRVIEEFMIAANVAAAEELETRAQPVVYRVHEPPDEERVEALRRFLATLKLPLARGRALKPKDFNHVLALTAESPDGRLVNQVVLRAQSQAVYATGNLGHFGLNLARYAHFTSPIRRYADLLVHRALLGQLSRDDIAGLDHTARQISLTERRAMAAERETVDRLVAHYLRDEVGAEFQALVSGLTRAGLFVTLEETGADGFLPASALGPGYFTHDEKRHAMVSRGGAKTFRLGDRVRVRLLEVAPVTGGLRFEIAGETPRSPSSPRRLFGARRGKGRS